MIVRQLLSRTLIGLFILGIVLPVHSLDGPDPRSDEKAIQIAEQVLEAMGGRTAWEGTRFIRFDFSTVREGETVRIRSHWWDRQTGRHRVEGTTRETGEPWVVIQNLNTREGAAWQNGKPVPADEMEEPLRRAWGTWVNDTYWLLMPYKLLDPGVTLKHDGEEEIDGKSYDRLHLSFENVGLTPGDQYWAWINRETGLMDRWEYLLQGRDSKTGWNWGPWRDYGAIKLAPERHTIDGERTLLLDKISVFEEMPDAVFERLDSPRLTRVKIRAVSRDAKVIGTKVGGALIGVRDLNGAILSSGMQMGGTGNTTKIMIEPRERGDDVYDTEGTAEYIAHLWLSEPTVIEAIAEGPIGTPQSTQRATKTLLVLPGQDLMGDGVLLEIHGFTVTFQTPEDVSEFSDGEEIPVRILLTMT